ncbi:MAG: TonB-dependent receptor [Bacteroidetes bacterium MedPE-SWsnd-G2]|nr:MAG: TonB-dependent receptor [Bacteroidetes bacterium MedPE-SWsnd-G2]
MKLLKVLFILVFGATAFGQNNYTVSGTLLAGDNQQSLESATVHLERLKDSSLVKYTISDKNGKFSIEDKTNDEYLNLFVTYIGFETYTKKIQTSKGNIDLGVIELQISNNMLDEVLVKSRAPITVKKDTLEFNVSSFKTKKDANVEELLKQLPGVQVDEAGKITVNGQDVSQILVNGKPFFGDDPTITTRNLTKEIIEKVQITNTKTKSEAVTGEAGNAENKTINLTIKEENNKGVFGRVAAGGGTDERWELAGMFNTFDNDRRISVLAGGNNTNSPGFSFGEIQKMFGSGNSMSMSSNGSFSIDGRNFGGGQGITTSQNAGANYADSFGEKFELSANYFYSGSDSKNESSTQRENILADSRYFTDSESASNNEGDNHNVNMEFDIEIDSTFYINIEPKFNRSLNTNTYTSEEMSYDENFVLSNESETNSLVKTEGTNFENELSITKRFGAKGAFVRLYLGNDFNNSKTEDFLRSRTDIFSDTPTTEIRDQYTDGERDGNGVNTMFTFRLPLIAKEFFLDFRHYFDITERNDRKSTFDKNDTSGLYTDFNLDLSTDFEFRDETSTPALRLSYRKKDFRASFQAGYVFRNLENKDLLRPDLNIDKNYENLEIRSYLRYKFNQKASMYAGYNLRNNAPGISQLQPFENVSNPLNTITGNPDLKPISTHRFYGGYHAFDYEKGTGFYFYANGNIDENRVVAKTTIDEDLVRNTTYTNVNGAYRINGGLNWDKKIKSDSIQTIKFGIGVWGASNKNVNFNNDVQYSSVNNSVSPELEFNFEWKEIAEIRPRYSISFNNTKFDLDEFEDESFVSHNLGIVTSTFLPKNFEWRNDINYNYNPNISDGFQKSSWFWNATLAYSLMKDSATITLKAYDLLNQNTNAERTATSNYIQDSQSTVLEQYFMLSFSWKFNSLGSKGEIGDGSMRWH